MCEADLDMGSEGGSGEGPKPILYSHRHNLKSRFELLKTLGEGSYGKVKLAKEKTTGELVGDSIFIKSYHNLFKWRWNPQYKAIIAYWWNSLLCCIVRLFCDNLEWQVISSSYFLIFFTKISPMVLISRWCHKVCYCLNRSIKNADILFRRKRNEWLPTYLTEIIYSLCVPI